jgi:penicillin-binding protein 2
MRLAEIRNHEREMKQCPAARSRCLRRARCLRPLAARFFYLQLFQHSVYQAKAKENRISVVPVSPNRGLILDRNGLVIARNYSGYTLEIYPRRVANMEKTIDELAELVDIQPRDRARFRKLVTETRNAENLPIRNR